MSTLLLVACVPPALLPPGPLSVIRQGAPVAVAAEEITELVLPGAAPERSRPEDAGGSSLDLAIATRAVDLLDEPLPPGFADDCSGYVAAAASLAGVELPPATRLLWELAVASGAVHHDVRPAKGDLAFFDDTWDKDGNGRVDDPLTHVGVVVDVEDDGTILVAHRSSSQGRTLLHMNLLRPHERHDEDGRTLNDYLRRARRGDPDGTQYLSAELCRGFATPSQLHWTGSARG
jgi:hypothetical protein